MEVKITKRQEIVDGEAREVKFEILLERRYKAEWRKPENLCLGPLFLDELKELHRAIGDKLAEENK